jgi:hypothetical protein
MTEDNNEELQEDVERLTDALDHIMRTARNGHRYTRRQRWIVARAQSAIDNDEKWREYDIPRPRKQQQENLRERVKAANKLLEVANCPECKDGSGAYAVEVMGHHGEQELELQQCQWCTEKAELLAIGK